MIDSTSIISSSAKIHKSVKTGPYCIIDENVIIGKGTELISHIHISGHTSIGMNNKFYPFSTIGMSPQDNKYMGEKSKLVIGDNSDSNVSMKSSKFLTMAKEILFFRSFKF